MPLKFFVHCFIMFCPVHFLVLFVKVLFKRQYNKEMRGKAEIYLLARSPKNCNGQDDQLGSLNCVPVFSGQQGPQHLSPLPSQMC